MCSVTSLELLDFSTTARREKNNSLEAPIKDTVRKKKFTQIVPNSIQIGSYEIVEITGSQLPR